MLVLAGNSLVEIDVDDVEAVSGFDWKIGSGGYAVRHRDGKVELMHRVISGAADGVLVDHKNGNKLDNRRCNLRFCCHAENMRNRKISKNNKSGFKGVYQQKNFWRAQIKYAGKKHLLGCFATPEAAHDAYCEAAKRLHGEFARFA
ncbi:HNH endonuclease [Ralstonia pickettii]|uniref:HNH endonuclease n=2 Tax=Ralstonia pickettii TaxID=329 RepID=UPI0038576BE7